MSSLRHLVGPSEFLQGYDVTEPCDDGGDSTHSAKQTNGHGANGVSDFARLAGTIETEILPRLVLAYRETPRKIQTTGLGRSRPTDEDVITFADIVVRQDVNAAHRYIAALCERGVRLESVFLDLLAPAARHLGKLWVEDICDFATVTLALSRMQQVLNALSPAFKAADTQPLDRNALLVTLPDEQHTFGVHMVAEFFRRDGWDVWSGVPESNEEVLDLVLDQPFDVIGVSVSCDTHAADLDALVRRIRATSRNREVRFLLGGRVFVEHPGWAPRIGADAVGVDGRQAVLRANELLGAVATR